MQCYLILLALTLGSLLHAQEYLPHPYAFAGLEGTRGGGYAPFALVAGAGFQLESERLLLDATARYDNARKVNDNDQPNPKGRHRGLAGSAYYRSHGGWSFGGGLRWNELSTTKYKKSAWHPTLGGSKDYIHRRCAEKGCGSDFSMRLGVDYVLRGSDWMNGSEGPLFTFYLPSPSMKAHIFYRETVGIYRCYDTVTDRANAAMTREQMSNHHWSKFAEITLMYRF